MNESAIPTMIRREVSYGNAVHIGTMILERFVSRYVPLNEIGQVLEEGDIPVVTEPYKTVLEIVKPDIVVDAVMAGKNLGTTAEDAPLVIALGSGFSAGKDVDVVVEITRGHYLGRLVYEGTAISDRGIQNEFGGTTKERIIYAPCGGLFTAKRHIGEEVQKGECIGQVEKRPVIAKISGRLRGILASGLMVAEGCKIADIDARCEEGHCFSISDRALSVGGGVMEAILAWREPFA